MSRNSSLSIPSGMHHSSSLVGPHADPTPPSSLHPDHPSPNVSSLNLAAPDTPPANTEVEEGLNELRCMFVQDCDTNSTLRKAISHIFGRNKMCTRLIPSRVWVHYCRKHYQRSRYRNPKEYAKLQCDLVQEQIRRIHDWSEKNSAAGQPGVVQDWGLAIRKREQKRLDDLQGASRKRRAATFENEDMNDAEGDMDDGLAAHTPPTAVPKWLLERCGKGYSTSQILEIFNKLHTEVLQDQIPQFPDIEILPNITTDSQETPKSPKGYAKRSSSISSHRRSQSLGVSIARDYIVSDRRMSQPAIWGPDGNSFGGSPTQKRRRANEDGSQERFLPAFPRSRMSGVAPRLQPTHRPVFPDISENYGGEDSYIPYQHPLPAPTPQRSNGHSMAAHLESNNDNLQMARRPMHGRSHSEASFAAHRMAAPSIYGMDPHQQNHEQNRAFLQQGQVQQNGFGYDSPQQYREEPRQDMRMGMGMGMGNQSGYGHQRHQSTPMISQYQTNSYGREPQSFQQQETRQYTQNNPTIAHRVHIIEAPSARNIFAERR
jgi:hypothetical protein